MASTSSAQRWSSSATSTVVAGGRSTSSARAAGTRCRSGTSERTRSSASTSARGCSNWPRGCPTPTGAPARWIEADVLDTPHDLDGTGDLVYTGRGSLPWIADLDRWAAVVVRLLAPEGRFVLFEGHPAEWLFDADDEGRWILTDYDYFGGVEASRGWAPEYIDRLSIPDGEQHWKFARAWTLGEVVTALVRAGLRLDALDRAPDRLVGRTRRRPPGGTWPPSLVVLGRRSPRRLEHLAHEEPREPSVGLALDLGGPDDRGRADRAVDVRIRIPRLVVAPGNVQGVEIHGHRQERLRIVREVAIERRGEVLDPSVQWMKPSDASTRAHRTPRDPQQPRRPPAGCGTCRPSATAARPRTARRGRAPAG